MVRILGKERQQVEFLGCELLLLTIHPDTSGGLVNLNATDLNNVVLRLAASDQTLIAGKMCLHAGHQLTWGKRLCNIIICAKSQSTDLVNIILLCRNHQNRRILFLSDLLADFKSVHPRQHKI